MFTSFERWVAGRYLRARRQEGFISVIAWFSLIGIALGVATLIIVMSVMNGFRQELLDRILGVGGHVIIHASIPGEGIADFDRVTGSIAAQANVVMVTPGIEGQVMATAGTAARGAMVRGIRPRDLRAREIIANGIVDGSLDGFSADADTIVIGYRLARSLGVAVGGEVTLISPEGRSTVFGTVPRARAYRVAAMFDVGMIEYDSSFVYMPLSQAQLYFRLPEQVNEIEVFINEPKAAGDARDGLRALAGENVYAYSWQQANAQFVNALKVERNVMFLILTLIILVAAFNIISSLIMLVHDKSKGIAILRTMGATRGMIMRIFFLTGASVGVIGTVAGFLLGYGFVSNIEHIRQGIQSLTGWQLFPAEVYFLSNLPAKVDPTEVGTVVVMSLVLSFLATIYPAWRAARLDPVEALRYE